MVSLENEDFAIKFCHLFELVDACLPHPLQHSKVHVLDTESFEHTFGAKSQRRRPRLQCGDLEVCSTDMDGSSVFIHTYMLRL